MENQYWTRYERLACLAGADGIHLLLEEYVHSLPRFLHGRVTVIPNPVRDPCPVDWGRRDRSSRKTLLAVGRFEEEAKRFSFLLTAFALLAGKFPDWDLCICGDGEYREQYTALAQRLGISSRLVLPGWVDNVDEYYAASHLLCLPSRHEAFGLTSVEAQRHALPVVGFAGCAGTNAIILNGINGLLAEEDTPVSLAACLAVLMGNAGLRVTMGLKGQELLKRYAYKRVYDRWEELFARTAAVKGATSLRFPPMNEEERCVNALREILAREHPEQRPACAKLERRVKMLSETRP
jgi:glycosyltransferase involved in cell wall biosynthesis